MSYYIFTKTYIMTLRKEAYNIMKKQKYLKNKIGNMARDFDRSYDNTVVDTYAFDKVLKSKSFSDMIYKYFSYDNMDFSLIKEKTSSYVINEVAEIYEKTQRKVVEKEVYHEYIEALLGRIIQAN